MNKYASEILGFAYKQYQNSDFAHCSVQLSGSANDIAAYHNAMKNLLADGYIENLTSSGLTFTFNISAIGIEYMSADRKL